MMMSNWHHSQTKWELSQLELISLNCSTKVHKEAITPKKSQNAGTMPENLRTLNIKKKKTFFVLFAFAFWQVYYTCKHFYWITFHDLQKAVLLTLQKWSMFMQWFPNIFCARNLFPKCLVSWKIPAHQTRNVPTLQRLVGHLLRCINNSWQSLLGLCVTTHTTEQFHHTRDCAC